MIASKNPGLLYEQVADKIAGQIEAGTLRPGDRVPSVRRASQQHRVSVTTAVQAYLALENRGLIEARPKSGFYVRSRPLRDVLEPGRSSPCRATRADSSSELLGRVFEAVNRPGIVPLGAACPSPELLPVQKLNRTLAVMTRSAGTKGIEYDMPPGALPLRRQVARRSPDWGVTLAPDDIVTTSGSMEALTLCLRAVTKPGDPVAIESPTYFGIVQLIESLGLKAIEIPTHPRTGMDLDALDRTLAARRIAACLAIPNFNNPLGSLMPESHQQRLVEMLARREIPLIEDDIYGELHFGPKRPRVAKSFDKQGLVLLCSSFSKTIAPGYRVGWTAPGRFLEKVRNLKFTSTLATATLPQLAIAEFVANGGYDHHLRAIRRTFAEQVQRVSEAVAESFPPGIRITRPAGGFVIWIELPRGLDSLDLHARAMAEEISIAPGPMFSPGGGFGNFIRLSCGYPWSPRIERAIGILGSLTKRLG
jgi:DNA-binding transcriptional MocR family regulator